MSFPAVTLANPWETFLLKHLSWSAIVFLAGWFTFLCADSSKAAALATLHFGIKPHIFNPLIFVININMGRTCIYMC